MKTITIDDQLYAFIASQTKHIGESASDILRRLLIENTEYTGEAQVTVSNHADAQVTDTKSTPASPEQTATPVKKVNGAKGEDVFAILENINANEFGSRVDAFLMILSALYQGNPQQFSKVLEVKGRNRLYFGTSKEQLLESGSSTNPKQIPNSNFWVVTNNNTAKKSSMLAQAAAMMGYNEAEQEKLVAIFTR